MDRLQIFNSFTRANTINKITNGTATLNDFAKETINTYIDRCHYLTSFQKEYCKALVSIGRFI